MSARLVLAAGLLMFPLTGCVAAAVGTAGAVGVAAAQDRSVGQAVDDATASNEIKAKLLSEAGYGEVDVEVANGLVLLSGRVNSPELRVRAEDLAWSSQLTQDVANEIQIQRPGGFFANVSDEVITARVRANLVGSSTVKSVNFNIETYDGVVYLMGIARTQEELVAAAEEAANVTGVQQVVSYVRVRPSATIAQPAPSQGPSAPAYSGAAAEADKDLLGGTY
ncbi:MAG: BON domain-containing protein [Hyphomonadaceae bacterium]|nr:BON domain-containing protein [Hyphomonadaceae bacterium]